MSGAWKKVWVNRPPDDAEAPTMGRGTQGSTESEKGAPGNRRLGWAEKIPQRLLFGRDR